VNSPFSREDLGRRLGPLTARHWIAFAAGCAERLVPIFALGEEAWGWHGRSREFSLMLDSCWALALDPSDAAAKNRVMAPDWEGLARDGNINDSKGYRLFVYQAIPTLEVTLNCARDQTLERATYAAQKEYDATFRITDWGLSTSSPRPGMSVDEARAAGTERLEKQLRHPLVQTSIRMQTESADELSSQPRPDGPFLASFRKRENADGRLLLTMATKIYPRRP
jgi:hypothetical protein